MEATWEEGLPRQRQEQVQYTQDEKVRHGQDWANCFELLRVGEVSLYRQQTLQAVESSLKFIQCLCMLPFPAIMG